MQWLEEDFLGYLDIWESSVQAKDIPPVEKQKLLLSRETLDGLRITGKDALYPSLTEFYHSYNYVQ